MYKIKGTFVSLFNLIIKHKLFLFIVAVSVVALALPGAFVFATENAADEAQQPAVPAAEEQASPAPEATAEEVESKKPIDEGVVIVTGEDEDATESENGAADEGVVIVTDDDSENAEVTVTGTLKDKDGNAIPEINNPYVMIAGYHLDLFNPVYQERIYLKNGVKDFTFTKVPSGLTGVITAGAEGYANEILSISSDTITNPKQFKLNSGSDCTFFNDEDKLDQYVLCEGSYFKSKDGATEITLPMDIDLGGGLPVFGLQAGATFTETVDPYTLAYSLTYNYKDEVTGETIKLIFEVKAEDGWQFNYFTINDEILTKPYTVIAGKPMTVKPVFTPEGKMIVGGIVKDNSTKQPIENAYAYVLGWNLATEEVYISDYQYTDEDGVFYFDDIPDWVKGVIVVGAEGHTTQPQYISYSVPRAEFFLNPGIVCNIDASDEAFGTVELQAGSKIKIEGYEELTLPFPVDLGADFPPIGLPNTHNETITFSDKGIVDYSFTHDDSEHSVKSLSLKLKVYGKDGFAFKNWLKDGEEFSGTIELSKLTSDFTIKPTFREAAPYTFSTYIKNRQDERIANAYAYLVGIYDSTGEVYMSDPVTTGEDGVFAIENIPYDVYGIVVVGAPGYVNRFDYCDCDVEATFFTLDEGVQIDFQMPENASTVYIEKGTSVKLTVEEIPLEFALPYDVEFGNFFLPFGITPNGTFNFMEDGRLSFTYTKPSNYVNILSFNLITKVVPKEGYAFTGWLKSGQPISGEYTLQAGEKDFSITPVFEVPTPPQPTPVDPTIDPTSPMAKTFDGIEDWCIALAILFVAFMVVYSTRKFVFKK